MQDSKPAVIDNYSNSFKLHSYHEEINNYPNTIKFSPYFSEDIKNYLDENNKFNGRDFEYHKQRKPVQICNCEDLIENMHI